MILSLIAPFRIAGDVGPLGYGIGATHQMAEQVTPGIAPFSWLGHHAYEDEPTRIMAELGVLGFLLFFALRAALAMLALQSVFRLRTAFHRTIAISVGLILLSQFIGGVVFNVTGGLFYWYFAGLLFLVARLDRVALKENREALSEASSRVAQPALVHKRSAQVAHPLETLPKGRGSTPR